MSRISVDVTLICRLPEQCASGCLLRLTLMGAAGSLRSSIFRCLGGLWAIPTGTITKPGGSRADSMNAEIFYLPQKPYNVHGSESPATLAKTLLRLTLWCCRQRCESR